MYQEQDSTMLHSYSNECRLADCRSRTEMTFIDLKGKIDMEKIENMLRLALKYRLTTFGSKQTPLIGVSDRERHLVISILKTFLK